jgi:hypothetical protein
VEPVFWSRLQFDRADALVGAASGLASAEGCGLKAGSWIRNIRILQSIIGKINSDASLLNFVLIVLSYSWNLQGFTTTLAIQHSMIVTLLRRTCAETLTMLSIGIRDDAQDNIMDVGELKNLVSLELSFPYGPIRLPLNRQPWSLLSLRRFTSWTDSDPESIWCNFLAECCLPVIKTLFLMDNITTKAGAESLYRLYHTKRSSLQEIFVWASDDYYPTIIPHMTGINQLWVRQPKSTIIAQLPPSVSQLSLQCHDQDDIQDMYGVLDLLTGNTAHSIKIIDVEFSEDEFYWMSDNGKEYVGDGSIHYATLIQKLLVYTSKGLAIRDEKGKVLQDYIPPRS